MGKYAFLNDRLRIFKKSIVTFSFLFLFPSFSQALTLDKAIDLAISHSSERVAAQHGEDAAQSQLVAAGSLPDPSISFTFDDVPLNGRNRLNPDKGYMGLSVMQSFPHKDKRNAERLLAQAEVQSSVSQSRYTSLLVQRETTLAWLELYYLDRKMDVLKRQAVEARLKQKSMAALLSGGGSALVALNAQIEETSISDQVDDLTRQMQVAQARLARWVGVDFVKEGLSGGLPIWLEEERVLTSVDKLPELSVGQSGVSQAQAELTMAIAQKKSDWDLEVGVGRDSMRKPMAMVKLTFTLPLFETTRQSPRISAASSKAAQLEAEQQTRKRNYILQFDELILQKQSLQSQLKRLNQQTLPLLNQQIDLAMASLSRSKEGVETIFIARANKLNTLLRQVDLEYEISLTKAKIYYLTGGQYHE